MRSEGSGVPSKLLSRSSNLLSRYRWGFIIGSKIENKPEVPGMRYHIKNHPVKGWVYEEASLKNVKNFEQLLARVVVAKVEDENNLVQILRTTTVVQDDPNWNCRTWVAGVLSNISKDGKAVGTSQLDWNKIEAQACDYVAKKTAAGRYEKALDLEVPKPTWDIIENKEIIS